MNYLFLLSAVLAQNATEGIDNSTTLENLVAESGNTNTTNSTMNSTENNGSATVKTTGTNGFANGFASSSGSDLVHSAIGLSLFYAIC